MAATCKKCKTVLVKCPDCYGSGKKDASGSKCIRCKGTGMLCQIHEGNHGN
jgi:RecJ-like exonuclease